MTPEQIAEHILRLQVGMLQCRGNPQRALAMLGAMLAPFRNALDTPGGNDAKFAALLELVESLPAETMTSTLITILGFVGNGLQPGRPGPGVDLPGPPGLGHGPVPGELE